MTSVAVLVLIALLAVAIILATAERIARVLAGVVGGSALVLIVIALV